MTEMSKTEKVKIKYYMKAHLVGWQRVLPQQLLGTSAEKHAVVCKKMLKMI